ncbi:MAG: LPD23 domain-containing protein, partial [Thiohalospira sp.]
AESPDVRRALEQDAEAEEARARGESPKLTPEQRRRQRQRDNQTVRPEQDDLVTAIRKLGGLDTELETDWAQRLSHIDSERRPAPGQRNLERPGKPGARSLDDLAEPLQELGYLRNRDPRELEERLFSAERGAREYALPVEEDRMAQDMEEAERQRAEDEAEREAQADEADEIMSAFQDYAREVEAETPALDDAGEPAPFSEALLSLAREAENNDPGRVESIMEDAARQGRTETEVTSELLDIIRGEADADRAADPGRDPGAQEDGGETPSGSRAEAPIEAASAAGPAEGAAEEVGSLELEAQTEQVLADQQERIEAAEQAEADRRRQEEQRAQADAEVDEFTLAGSDLPADQAAARGQQDLMADTAPESAPAEFTPTHETSDGTPVRETEETGVFVDRDGVEVEDDAATPIGEDGAEGSALETAEREAQTSPDNDLPEPTEAQKAAGNYKVGKARLHGLDISIENPAGSTRSGTAPDGTEWSNTMTHPYGYIRGTEGKDGDQVDAYFGPDTESDNPTAYVVDQVDPESRRFDEHKVMFGFPSEEAAVKGYLDNYEKGWTGIGGVREMPLDEFKSWLQEGDTTKPVARRIPKSKARELASQYQADAEAEGDTEAEGSAEAADGQQQPDNQAEEAADDLIRKPDGSPYPSARAARAGRNRADLKDRKDQLEPVEVEGGWALRDTAEDQAGSAEGQTEVDRLARRATERLAEENPTMIRAAKGSVREDAPQGTLEDARRQIGRLWEKRLGAILAEDDAVDADAANEIMNRDQPMPDSELRWLAEQEAPAQEGSQNKGARGPRGQAEQALEEARTAAEQIPDEVGVKAEQIPFDLAERAHSGTSQTPDVRALQEQATYLREMVDAYEAMAPLATTDQKRADLVEALKDYSTEYARRQRDLLNARSGMMSSMVTGPAKFPQRSQQKKQGAYDKKAEDFDAWKKKARKDIRRKLRPEDAPVRATDADAVERLEAQITEREQVQERMKQANKIIRDQKRTEDEKRRALVDEVGLSESQADGALSPDFAGRKGFAQPTLNNNNAQIKRLRQRLSEIQDQKQAAEDTGGEVEAEFDGGRVTADFGERRLRVEHDQKPAQETRDALKAAGFRWSRANGAWQATLNNRAIREAEKITGAALGVDQSGNDRGDGSLSSSGDGLEGPAFSFAGKGAKTADVYSQKHARRLIREGVDPEEARRRTGWFKGPDGRWRFEISDDEARLKPAMKALKDGGHGRKTIDRVDYQAHEDGTYSV